MGRHALESSRNNNGERLLEFCADHNLFIGGTKFPHRNIHKYTWQSPDGRTRNQIDHLLISRRFHNSLTDVRTRRGADIYSDHNLVVGELRLRPEGIRKRQTRNKIFNTENFKNPATVQRYQQELSNALPGQSLSMKQIASACFKAAEKTLGLKQHKRKTWISNMSWQLIEERKQLKARLINTPLSERGLILQAYNDVHRQIRRSVKADKRNLAESTASKAEHAANTNNLRGVYTAIKKLTNSKPNVPPIKANDGSILTSVKDQLHRWEEFFKNDAANEEMTETEPNAHRRNPHRSIPTDPPSFEEISEAASKLKNNKSPGLDDLPAELFKYGARIIARALHPIIQSAWTDTNIPGDWKEGVIITIPKKGDLSQCKNWRGITLLNTVQKVLAFIILKRISPTLNAKLRKEQNGFRPSRSCVDHINTLRIIIEQSNEWRSPLYLLFVDFERAFDTISRDAIWSSLQSCGVPDKIIDIIKALYSNALLSVRFKGKLSGKFTINKGVRQGCLLSPLLFITVLDGVLKLTNAEVPEGLQWRLNQKLSDLDYADDICFMTHTLADATAKLRQLEKNARAVGLKINFRKTKLMRLQTTNTSPLVLTTNENATIIEDVDEFCYLGSQITKDGGAVSDVAARICKARNAFHKLSRLWRSRTLSRKTKLKIFNTSVKSVLLYGSETWLVSDYISRRLQTFVNKCLRIICRIFWPRTISNVDLLLLSKSCPINSEIKKRKWNWIGHTLRREDDNVAKMAFQWNPQGSRRRGRPRQTWMRTIFHESPATATWNQIRHVAADRNRWRTFVSALCSD